MGRNNKEQEYVNIPIKKRRLKIIWLLGNVLPFIVFVCSIIFLVYCRVTHSYDFFIVNWAISTLSGAAIASCIIWNLMHSPRIFEDAEDEENSTDGRNQTLSAKPDDGEEDAGWDGALSRDEMVQEIAKEYGYNAQSRICIEECAELIQSINKLWRVQESDGKQSGVGHPEVATARKDVVNEMADVQIMLWQMTYYLEADDAMDSVINRKLNRQMQRIDLERGEEIW